MPKERDSNLELFRILTMLVIVAHHYVVNSGLMSVALENYPSTKSLFLLLLGWGGKTGINCFVLITGYFMCTSNITLRKFLKIFLPFYFYTVLFFGIFTVTGYADISPKFVIKSLSPIPDIEYGFVSCYLVFFCFIPFLNLLIKGMTKRQHQKLLGLSLLIFTILPTFHIRLNYSYVSWFMVIYLVGSYIRFYPPKWTLNSKHCATGFAMSLSLSLASVWGGAQLSSIFGHGDPYMLVADSNKPLAILTSIFSFLFFKNMRLGYSKIINTVAASAFGVLLIHANSDTMRLWLWRDTLNNVEYFDGNIYLHAFASIFTVYVICTAIDFLRIQFLEKPFFRWFDRFTEIHNNGFF